MKKVLIIGMYNQLGGIENFIYNFFKHINKEQFSFSFISMYNHIAYEEEIKILGGKIYYISNVKKNPFKCYLEIKKIIKKEKYDVVHINMLSAANIIPLKAAKKAKAKYIIAHSHNNNIPNSKIKRFLHNINKNKIINYADKLLACSNEAGKWMYGNEKFEVINNAIEVNRFKYDSKVANKLKESLNISKKTVYGHVGRFVEQKNHTFLIDVFDFIHKKNPNTMLLLIGNGELKDFIKEKIKSKNIQDSVIIIDENKEVNKYYSVMDYFIFPSIFEGLGIVAIEAQASGIHCFASNNIPKDINIDNSVTFIDINKGAKYFSDQILKYSSKESRENLHEKVLNSKFNIDKEIIKLENIYGGNNEK